MKLFQCTDFNFSSTLQLRKYIGLLLEPVRCRELREKIELGLHEALVNAVIHGNNLDPQKNVRVSGPFCSCCFAN